MRPSPGFPRGPFVSADPNAGDLREDVHVATGRALSNLSRLQDSEGGWRGDYGGPMFLLPMYVALCHAAAKRPPGSEGMIAYLFSAQNEDGSLGLHAEDTAGSMFTTSLGYVALRILGVEPDDPRLARMRGFIHAQGTPLAAASWGKFTLALLGLYDFRGIHPVLPELWLLPRSLPLHPGRLWCHCRQVYLPMAWLYGAKASIAPDELVCALREELYAGLWDTIDWPSQRDTLAPREAYRPPTRLLRFARRIMLGVERARLAPLRRKALVELFDHISYEDRVTDFIDIGPVNKVLNAFVHHFREPGGEAFHRAFSACEQYLWDGHDGRKMQGYNSSKLWDTAFALQAIGAGRAAQPGLDVSQMVDGAYAYLRDQQILEDVPHAKRYFRDSCRGGFPFSNRAHGWPITDCTAEALKCAFLLEGTTPSSIPEDRLQAALGLILSWQNDDGGWATYERQRGPAWLELLNPSEVFGDIMVDYSYVECTSACLQALCAARRYFEASSADTKLRRAIERGAKFLRKKQRRDGSFEGSWGVCFTYGTFFGVSGLLSSGASPEDPAIVRACAFLLEKQRPDGGWGEHGDSCRERRYVDASAGSFAQTSWALLALVRARDPNTEAQARAARFLVSRQTRDGAWPREPFVGVFNRTCLINYDNYRHYFPLWALGEWYAADPQRRADSGRASRGRWPEGPSPLRHRARIVGAWLRRARPASP